MIPREDLADDLERARQRTLTLTDFDDGNSKTNTLWWVATRP